MGDLRERLSRTVSQKTIADQCTYKLTSMSIYFNRLRVGYPDEVKALEDWHGCWKIYTICINANPSSCTTRADIRNLEVADKRDARSTYVSFTNKAHTGQPLSDLYDEKQCHEAHSFNVHEQTIKIFRIWGSGDIRIYFCYLQDRNIVLLKTWPKRKDKLTRGEELELERIAYQVFECLNTDTFTSRVI